MSDEGKKGKKNFLYCLLILPVFFAAVLIIVFVVFIGGGGGGKDPSKNPRGGILVNSLPPEKTDESPRAESTEETEDNSAAFFPSGGTDSYVQADSADADMGDGSEAAPGKIVFYVDSIPQQVFENGELIYDSTLETVPRETDPPTDKKPAPPKTTISFGKSPDGKEMVILKPMPGKYKYLLKDPKMGSHEEEVVVVSNADQRFRPKFKGDGK